MRQAALASLIFLAAFGLNLSSLSPAVHPDDSPETVTAAYTLSIQHPPGYPLHSLLGRLACLSLPGGPAFRVNLLSAMLGALGLLLFAFSIRLIVLEFFELDLTLLWAAAPTALLACTYSLWFQSSIAKGGIYALNFALSQATLLALLNARHSDRRLRDLRLAALFFGLGMANHWTSQVVLLPAYAILLAELWAGAGKPRIAWRSLEAACITGTGLSLYLFLPLRSLLIPVMSWGEPWTLKGFFWVFNRAQYAGVESGKTLAAFIALLQRVAEDLKYEYHWLGMALLLWGWAALFRKRPWLAAALLSMPVTLVLAVCVKANPPSDSLWVIDPYLLPLYSGAALGFAGFRRWMPWLAWGALALGIWHWPMASQRNNYLGYDYVSNLYLSLPKNSLLFCEGDSNTALPLYNRHVLNKRADVAAVATVLSDYPWYMAGVSKYNPGLKVPPKPLSPPGNIQWMAQANVDRPTFVTNSLTKDWVDQKRILPRGLVNQLLSKGPASNRELHKNRVWPAYSLRGVFAPALPMDPLTVRLVRDNYKETPARLAYALQEAGDPMGAETEFQALGRLMPGWAPPWIQAGNCAYFAHRLEFAGADWKRAVEEEPKSAEALANLGLYFYESKNYDESLNHARKALEINPELPNAKDLLEKSRAMLNRPAGAQAPTATQWAAKGDAFAQKNQATEALAAYDEAQRLGFVSAGVYRNRAVMLAALKRMPEAAAELKKAIKLEPKNAELHKYLGIMLYNAGDAKGALQSLKESQKLNPADSQISGLLSQVEAGVKP